MKYNAHTDKLFGDLKILKVKELHKIAAIRTIKKSHLKKTPETISNIFSKIEQTRALRQINNIRILISDSKIYGTFPRFWNELTEEYKEDSISLKRLINENKQTSFEKYRSFRCNDTRCYTCSINN